MTGNQRRALLVSGGVNHSLNHLRYRNDLEVWCSALIDRGFQRAVCYANGLGFSLSGVRVGPATRMRLDGELARFEELDETDVVLILVTNHGDEDGFCLWGGESFTPQDLVASLAQCRAAKVIIMGQCFGGVFSSVDLPRAVLITACGPTEESWACADPPGPKSYDEFLYQLASALFDRPSETKEVASISRPTLRAAFDQARVHDRRPETPSITDSTGIAGNLVL